MNHQATNLVGRVTVVSVTGEVSHAGDYEPYTEEARTRLLQIVKGLRETAGIRSAFISVKKAPAAR